MVLVTCGEHKSAIGIIKEDDGTGTLPIRVRYIDETGYDFYEPFELEPYSCTISFSKSSPTCSRLM